MLGLPGESAHSLDINRNESAVDSAELDAQVDKALASRRFIQHGRHRSSISMSLFRSSQLKKTDSRSSGVKTEGRDHDGRNDPVADEVVLEEDEGEVDPENKERRRIRRRDRRANQDPAPPIQLLVRKAEPAKPVNNGVSGLPQPRHSHVHFPSSDPSPEGSSSQKIPEGLAGESPAQRSTPDSPLRSRLDDGSVKVSSSAPLVNLLASGLEERKEAKAVVRNMKKGQARDYVWDVLFENQRGILFMGTPHFSKATLFPFDPQAFTVPIHALKPIRAFPTTDRSAAADPPPHNTLRTRPFTLKRKKRDGSTGKHHDKSHLHSILKHTTRHHEREHKSMNTPYDLKTYQPPSSQWLWLTPWLINMRQDGVTDERGWEYNYIFRKHGWGASVPWSGWGGWVRRRMWVRLRTLKVNEDGEEEEEWRDEDESVDFYSEGLDLEDPEDRWRGKEQSDEPYTITVQGDTLSRQM